MNLASQNTIYALATAPGIGAIAIIRLSGSETIALVNSIFFSVKGKQNLLSKASHTLHFGTIRDENRIIDEVLISLFKGPTSYTGEDTIEISCHGSLYVQQQIMQLLAKKGAVLAKPGEYTLRAFLNGKMDLSQAEAVADLIASSSEAEHKLALQQMRGGFSEELKKLREELIQFASLIELELDFSEEDVEFANRGQLEALVSKVNGIIRLLIESFSFGNVIKNGVSVAIVGEPNAGKSTLLNKLLNEDRAIVSDIAGTTRDAIEDTMVINGITFRFIDTAGIRKTTDTIESIGISKTFEKVKQAFLILFLIDAKDVLTEQTQKTYQELLDMAQENNGIILPIVTKIDLEKPTAIPFKDAITISAKTNENINDLKQKIVGIVKNTHNTGSEMIVTNARHFEALNNTHVALNNVEAGLKQNITGDFLAIDIRKALYHLGEITGTITNDTLLESIFTKFCIGK